MFTAREFLALVFDVIFKSRGIFQGLRIHNLMRNMEFSFGRDFCECLFQPPPPLIGKNVESWLGRWLMMETEPGVGLSWNGENLCS